MQIGQSMLSSRRANMHKAIGTGCGNRRTCRTNQREGNRMARHANSNGVQSCRNQWWYKRTARQDQCQRSRPECTNQLMYLHWNVSNQSRQRAFIRDMYNQWVAQWPSFSNKYALHSTRLQYIGTKAINGLGRENNNLARANRSGCTLDP